MNRFVKCVAFGSILALLAISLVTARPLALDEAVDIALNSTGRGGIIKGNLEVAEQQYFAEKIGFYLPEISINGRLPAYSVNEDYDFAQGTDLKYLIKRKDLDFDADITLKQSLITGGELTLRANLVDNDWEYPVLKSLVDPVDSSRTYYLQTVEEQRRRGTFNFIFEQPLLKPSEPKYLLKNRRDELQIARLKRSDDAATLEKEVIEAYLGVLQSQVEVEKSEDNLARSSLQLGIDSVKLSDGVLSEEQLLESTAERLDAELEKFEKESAAAEQRRDLATLLDLPSADEIEPTVPGNIVHLDESAQQRFLTRWEECVPLVRARHEYEKEKRTSDYAAGSHGLTGTLRANYGLDRGSMDDNRSGSSASRDVETDSWGVSVNLTYPLWDGGASGAAVKAARLSAEQARLEYEKNEKSVQAEIAALVNRLNVSYRKLDVLKQKISIAQTKLDIAHERMDDGQISRLTFLDSRVSFLEARSNYLEELKTYCTTRVDLESKYLN